MADWLNSYVVAQHPEKEALREKWMKAKDRWAARAGWHLTASRVNKGADGLDLVALLDVIETQMPGALPKVQWTMNNTLAAIGIHHPKHRQRAVAIGEKIGLYRDWPVSKGCPPPYVPVWVEAIHPRVAGQWADVVRGAIEVYRPHAREPAGVRLGGGGNAV